MTRADTAHDVAVVGAGVSGAYAFRLQQQQIGARRPKRIALFNYDNRIGGRLLTRTMPGMPHVNAALRGMRFIPGNQFLTTRQIAAAMGYAWPANGNLQTATTRLGYRAQLIYDSSVVSGHGNHVHFGVRKVR